MCHLHLHPMPEHICMLYIIARYAKKRGMYTSYQSSQNVICCSHSAHTQKKILCWFSGQHIVLRCCWHVIYRLYCVIVCKQQIVYTLLSCLLDAILFLSSHFFHFYSADICVTFRMAWHSTNTHTVEHIHAGCRVHILRASHCNWQTYAHAFYYLHPVDLTVDARILRNQNDDFAK